MGYLDLTIKVADFGLLISVKSSCFFLFFLRGYLGLMTRVTCQSTLDLIFIGLSSSHDPGYEFEGLT